MVSIGFKHWLIRAITVWLNVRVFFYKSTSRWILMVIKLPMAKLNYEFCDKVKPENWATIDSFYISDHNLTMNFECKKSPP